MSFEAVPSDPAELDRNDPIHRAAIRILGQSYLRAPFDVLDFHWYACREAERGPSLPYSEQAGEFLYLSKAGAYVNGPSGLRALLADWWWSGDSIPLWCSETGISSHASPGLEPDVPADQIAFGYRVDPATVRVRTGSDDPACWPDWVFTSEREQARQVWTRLSYLAAMGVSRTLWYANQAETQGSGEDLSRFYSFGLTSDVREDADTDYVLRRKKLGFCALRRWNEYLEHFLSAEVALGLDGTLPGLEGFYGVLFERSPGSVAAATYDTATYPHALLLWADPQAYDWIGFPAGCNSVASPPSSKRLSIFFRATSSVRDGWIIATVPQSSPRSDALESLCTPCIEDGGEPIEGAVADDFRGPELMRFDPPMSIPVGDVLPVEVVVDRDPILLLLPPGELLLDPLDGTTVTVPDLSSLLLARAPFSLPGAG
ncbi:hypothetical protein L6R50_10270 [Myxococcota bacterium]|nr:hypothetical protein [Myxococcota bacterium]